MRRSRKAFTLMEVMTALTITALVATLAASALHAGIDVRERVQTHRVTIETEARATSWLSTMLRHSPPSSAVSEPMLTVVHANGNVNQDELTFLSKGVESPYGTGPVWRVTLAVLGDGLHIHAVPANAENSAMPLESVLPHVIGLHVEVLDANGGVGNSAVWRGDWPVLRTMPRAVRIMFSLRDGTSRDAQVFSVGTFGDATP
jgi:prepilin-type N-terminal cleavage/methylation domain-containing protein